MFGSSKHRTRQSSAGGGNRLSPVGGEIIPRRDCKWSSKNEDDKNFAGLRGSVGAKKETEVINTEDRRVSGRSENHGDVYTAAQYLEAEDQRTE